MVVRSIRSKLRERCKVDHVSRYHLIVEFSIAPCIDHLMSLRAGKQLVHAIRTSEDSHWYPTLTEFKILSQYFLMLHDLSRDKMYPTPRLIRRLSGKRRPQMLTVLQCVYGTQVLKRTATIRVLSAGLVHFTT